jgi:predicted metal-dependent peptidase
VEEFIPGVAVRLESLGGGGNDFRPVFERLDHSEEPPVALVYLTDGYGCFPDREPEYTVLLASTAVERIPFGCAIML